MVVAEMHTTIEEEVVLRFMHKLAFIIIVHRKQIYCLETRIVQKIIDNKGSFIVNLVVQNVTKEEAGDCEAKLIQYYRTLKADGEEFTLNSQLEHQQIKPNLTFEQYLNLIERNL